MASPELAQETWPPLPLEGWQETYRTLHMWTQMAGKVRLALAPPTNHWWGVTLYVTSRGLTTSAIPHNIGSFGTWAPGGGGGPNVIVRAITV